jgi:hypothetical protein
VKESDVAEELFVLMFRVEEEFEPEANLQQGDGNCCSLSTSFEFPSSDYMVV